MPAFDLHAALDGHDRVFLAFSGGKESVVLAHMLEPWRDRVTLLWTNTGHMAPHMVEFVRAYSERFRLVELAPASLMGFWRDSGIPSEVVPTANASGDRLPRIAAWQACCAVNRTQPKVDHLARYGAPCAYVHGQRRDDPLIPTWEQRYPENVEAIAPLWEWAEADVMAYIARHGLALPAQYGEGYRDSLECIVCPAPMTAQRMAYLRRAYPEAAETAAQAMRVVLQETERAAIAIAEVICAEK
ncbi:hypothetical protein SLNSH_22820 [Alsobacter soli]|uniref:Phosphoadenosine phosphosulphate reductase domain-containing protein n=1 Tax=Alsobacter soli TaxID=2109933 RepID=A0A2T1HM26_9HYPH|nr:phosphoadenosine phosphosulfate reductase family protein [Alsobacter soli]PSC02697.1 hypothetical protein SLNSH_22820 [Alsobacter soli]